METNKWKLSKILSVLVDIIVFPILIATLICCVMMMNAKRQNLVPSLFGYSVVTIQSGSMEPNFHVKEVVVLKKVNAEDVNVGDIIAFYGGDNRENSMVIFHRVIAKNSFANNVNGVNGIYFVTQGDNNGNLYESMLQEENPESYSLEINIESDELGLKNKNGDFLGSDNSIEITSANFLVGKYVQSVGMIGEFVKFCSSSMGIIILVILPACVVLLFLWIEFSGQIKEYKKQKKLKENSEEKTKDAIDNNGKQEKPAQKEEQTAQMSEIIQKDEKSTNNNGKPPKMPEIHKNIAETQDNLNSQNSQGQNNAQNQQTLNKEKTDENKNDNLKPKSENEALIATKKPPIPPKPKNVPPKTES